MDIFDSQWLISMLVKSSKTPQGRILSLFDILSDWLDAPDIKIDINQQVKDNIALVDFFAQQAKSCGAENPRLLAEHIILMAKNAAKQQLALPTSNSLIHAKKVADALIISQTQKHFLFKKSALIGMAASLFVITSAGLIYWQSITETYLVQIAGHTSPNIQKVAFSVNHKKTEAIAQPGMKGNTTLKEDVAGITANDAVLMYAKFDQMRSGTCQFPEALQIPDKDKAVYIENVVGGKVPTNLQDLAVANFYLERVRCNYTPILMAHSK